MKKLIAFIVCLALCISSVLIGAMNVADSTKGTVADSALEGLAAGVTSTPTPEVENTNGAIEPDATKGENYYILTGNVIISSVDALADVKTALNAGGTFDGQGYTLTLTTAINGPLFQGLTKGTIKNLVVDGEITAHTTLEHGVFVDTVGTTADITFDTVVVKVIRKNVVKSSGGFVGTLNGKVTFTNCEYAGTIQGVGAQWCGGFAIKTDNAASDATFTNCTSSGTIQLGGNLGGFVAGAFFGTTSYTNCLSTVKVDRSQATTVAANGIGGFIGTGYNGTAGKSFTMEGCTSRATITIGGDAEARVGGFIGEVPRALGTGIVLKDCTSDCTVSVASNYNGNKELRYGGFLGAASSAKYDKVIKLENCTNNTDFTLTATGAFNVNAAGFIGVVQTNASYTTQIDFVNCVNNGNITVTNGKSTQYGGFVAYFCNNGGKGATTLTNCANDGDITIDDADGSANIEFKAAGIFGNVGNHLAVTVDGFTNSGDITVTSDGLTTGMSVAAGLFGNIIATNAKYVTVTNSTNTGAITVNVPAEATGDAIAAACIARGAAGTATFDGFVNEGVLTAPVTAIVSEKVTGTVSVTNTADVSAVADKTFTAVAGEGASWTTTISKDLYAAYGENVEFGAIITLKAYTDKIGEFTHANFDAYYTAHKAAIDANAGKELGRLYEIAKFDNGQTTLTEAELVGDNYVVNVRLNGADDYDYVVRTFVKIGDLYIYNN